jgi:preprotein translocase subunit SecY
MKRFITTIKNIFSITDLRTRILNTLLFLLIFRLGSFVVLPGLDPAALDKKTGGLLGFLDTILGGAFSNASIFGLGIMPYISASIVIQLLTVAVPYFQKMQKDGESGRKRLNQITRVLTIGITIPQSITYLTATIPNEAILVDRFFFTASAVIILTAGTIFCMWLGEKITDKGIGNGISMLIMIGIVSRLPGALFAEAISRGTPQALIFVVELVVLFFVVMFVVMLTQAVRRIPVQYAKQVIGNKVYGGQRQYIPLKLNAAGVMPIIFAQSLMFLPSLAASAFAEKSDTAGYIATVFADTGSWQYNISLAILLFYLLFSTRLFQ